MELKLPTGYTPQTAYTMLHRLLLLTRLSHVKTKPIFAKHIAFERAYDGVADLIDSITEQLIGYSGVDPMDLVIGTVSTMDVAELGDHIIQEADKLVQFAEASRWHNVANQSQELSGIGATLKFLSRYTT